MPHVYIIKSELTVRFYIGSTVNLKLRITDHNAGNTASTKHYRPWKLVYSEEFESLADARKREREIKAWKSKNYLIKTLALKDHTG